MGQIIAGATRRKIAKEENKMGTRALIGKRQGDKVRFIYNQSDGYVEHLGKTLLKHYMDSNKLDSLLDLGDINYLHSSLRKTKKDYVRLYTSYDKRTGKRSDKAKPAEECELMDFIGNRVGGEGYFYLWDNGVWWVCLDIEKTWYPIQNDEDIEYLINYYDKFITKYYRS